MITWIQVKNEWIKSNGYITAPVLFTINQFCSWASFIWQAELVLPFDPFHVLHHRLSTSYYSPSHRFHPFCSYLFYYILFCAVTAIHISIIPKNPVHLSIYPNRIVSKEIVGCCNSEGEKRKNLVLSTKLIRLTFHLKKI